MSLRDRLFNVAKAELMDAARKLRDAFAEEPRYDFDFERERSHEQEELPHLPSTDAGETAEIRRYYANLELPIGAPLSEVKAAYRRLMRRYHPDRHQTDPDRVKAANELAQRLREAYEGLTSHLERK